MFATQSAEGSVEAAVEEAKLPRHIAIIMDGNGRWAQQRKLSRIKGHKAAIPAVQETVQACVDLGIGHLTLYAFSTENWKRPVEETGTLMALLRQFLRMEMNTVARHGVRFQAIGDLAELDEGIQRDLATITERTAQQQGMRFNLALNYSGRGDILAAARRISAERLAPEAIAEDRFGEYLSTAGQPDPDLVIRTSGEYRVSNFLLWQIAYSEIWVTDTLWPDFRRKDLLQAIEAFQKRHRRFGGI